VERVVVRRMLRAAEGGSLKIILLILGMTVLTIFIVGTS